MKKSDYVIALMPTLTATFISRMNELAGLCGTILGIAFLVWRWKKEASKNINK